MKKTILVLAVAVMVLGTMNVAFADASWGPAAIFAGEKGISEADAYELKVEKDMTFGELAKEEGVYEAFQTAALAGKQSMIAEMVDAGEISEEEASSILAAFENCDGTQRQVLQGTGLFGQGGGFGQGNGLRAMDGEGFGAKEGGFGQGGGQMRRGGRN
ncbi:hypothetical protein [Gudongella sp. SC589]|jgi:hypothetical protein|uniref:hypothetical protein n=1 Tax=Gudongella sp. SC589 TaxID=3385990 RepID=UPI0039049E32